MTLGNIIKNSQGKVYYGMHFYPGVAEYQEPGKEPYRVYLNEDTLRSMDPTFAGRPIFVEHVDEVEENLDQLRKEADGWVIESFFNSADGKHWVKFIVVSERGDRAIRNRMRLSNAYAPKTFSEGGLWNGVSYTREITSGEFDHLAIVKNPRYEESIILTPEEFKQYNEEKMVELKRLSNSKEKGLSMKLNFFKRAKVENTIDLEGMHVVLPKSGREISITQLVNEMDESEEKKKNNDVMADPSHKVKMHDGAMCNVAELVEKHKALHDELESMKKDAAEPESDVETSSESVDSESTPEMENDEDETAKKKALELAEHEEKEIEAAKKKNELEAKKKAAKEKADKLRNAHLNVKEEVEAIEFASDKLARGRARYGSSK